MPILHAIVLGLTQGLSEFLPISSSGHLILVPWLFRWTELTRHPDLNKTFDVALHAGTLVAVMVYFRRDIVVLTRAGLRSIRDRAITSDDERLAWLLLLSAVPGGLAGVLFGNVIEDNLGQPWLIGVMLIGFGALLLVADRIHGYRDFLEWRTRDAVLMGAAQVLALQPGVSRSGITITAARRLGFNRDAAARASFLMMLPIIGGAALAKGAGVVKDGLPPGMAAPFLWGILASAVSGLAAVSVLIRFVQRGSFRPFVAYRVLAGLAVIATAASSFR